MSLVGKFHFPHHHLQQFMVSCFVILDPQSGSIIPKNVIDDVFSFLLDAISNSIMFSLSLSF